MATKPRTISLAPDVHGLLDQVGNVSDYLSQLVQDAWREWQEALGLLIGNDWRSAEILAVCDVLNGYLHLPGLHGGQAVALEMFDAQRLNKTATKHDVNGDRWSELVKQVSQRPDVADALLAVSREFWRMNNACEAAIRRVDQAQKVAAS